MDTDRNQLIEITWDGLTAQVSPRDYAILQQIEAGITHEGECWIPSADWSRLPAGYVCLTVTNDYGLGYVHRFVAFYFCGLILDEDMEAHHECENKSCCRPSHIKPLSMAAHRKQQKEAGQYLRGDQASWSILTEAQVLDCRRRYRAGETCPALAKEFGVKCSAMHRALTGVAFAHVGGAVKVEDVRKNRDHTGANHERSRLTEKKVLKIYGLYKRGKASTLKLGRIYNVSDETIRAIVQGKSWKYLELPPIEVGMVNGKYTIVNTHTTVPSSSLA